MHSANAVANKFLEIAKQRGDTLTPMQVIKLVYIAHGWMLGLYGRALIHDPIEAWKYGPVIPNLYHELKEFRSGPIPNRIKAKDEEFDGREMDLITQVYNVYAKKSGITLSKLTHQADSPWSIVWERMGQSSHIPDDLIEYHFSKLAE